MTRLLVRAPIVLLFAALLAGGAYWLGFTVFGDSFDVALTAAAVAGTVLAVIGLGSLTRVVGLVLLGVPIAVAALGSVVFVAGMHRIDGQPRLTVVVASSRCTAKTVSSDNQGSRLVCDRYAFTLTDTAGQPFGDALSPSDTTSDHSVGERLGVYQQKPGMVKIYPQDLADALPKVRTASRIAVPLFVAYIILCAIIGTAVRSRRRAAPRGTIPAMPPADADKPR